MASRCIGPNDTERFLREGPQQWRCSWSWVCLAYAVYLWSPRRPTLSSGSRAVGLRTMGFGQGSVLPTWWVGRLQPCRRTGNGMQQRKGDLVPLLGLELQIHYCAEGPVLCGWISHCSCFYPKSLSFGFLASSRQWVFCKLLFHWDKLEEESYSPSFLPDWSSYSTCSTNGREILLLA